ncbi:MAG: transcriptional repressor LexA [Acidobacteriia bacterium]|nr:transcriptional repressor LexA [Terriglobia bacterium]
MPLTRRQFEVLSFIKSFTEQKGYSPSFDEIRRGLALSSLATVHKHINTLERKGCLARDYNRSRSIEILSMQPRGEFGRHAPGVEAAEKFRASGLRPSVSRREARFELPLLGRIAAGKPIEAVPTDETLSLGDFVGSKNVYVLKVRGDSMIDDHICDGDFVVVESVADAVNGETVVALVDDSDSTLKRFYREKNGKVRLQPSNPGMPPMVYEAQRVKIQGRVIGVLRRF